MRTDKIVILIILIVLIFIVLYQTRRNSTLPRSSPCNNSQDCPEGQVCNNGGCVTPIFIPGPDFEFNPQPPPTPLCELTSRDLPWEDIANQTLLDLNPTYDDYPIMLKLPTSKKIIMSNLGSIIRMNLDGTADTTFAVNGKYQEASVVFLGYDNDENLYINTPSNPTGMRKLKASDGTIDTTFGSSGTLMFNPPTQPVYFWNGVHITLVQSSNGFLYVMGVCLKNLPSWPWTVYYPVIIKLSTDGVIDTSFGANGYLEIEQIPYYTVSIDNWNINFLADDGVRLIVSITKRGYFEDDWWDAADTIFLVGVNYDGMIDTTFGNNGALRLPNYIPCNDEIYQDIQYYGHGDNWVNTQIVYDGILYVGYAQYVGSNPGLSENCPTHGVIMKIKDGQIDTTFGDDDGAAQVFPSPECNEVLVRSITVRSDGSIFASTYGNNVVQNGIDLRVIALDNTGTPKTQYSPLGEVFSLFDAYIPSAGTVEDEEGNLILIYWYYAWPDPDFYKAVKFLCT